MNQDELTQRARAHLNDADANLRSAIDSLNKARVVSQKIESGLAYSLPEMLEMLRDDVRDCLSGPNYRSVRSIKAEMARYTEKVEDPE